MKNNSKSVVNFGSHGWVLILYCLLIFFFYVGMCNDGTNATGPAIAENMGVELPEILGGNSIGGVLGVILFVILGQVNRKIGARITSGMCCIVAGAAYIAMCNATSVTMYTAFYTIVVGTIMSAGYISGGTLVARWFPKRKGMVMGYTTMGLNLASAIYVPITLFSISTFEGIQLGAVPIGIGCIVLGIIGLLVIRNTPEERGTNPDNVSDEVYALEYDTQDNVEDTAGWTTGKLLKTKELWLAAIATGIFQICSVGVMTQMVLRNVEFGFEMATAVSIMSVIAIIGICGSWLVGLIDDKIGTKKTMIGFGIWYAVALFLNASEVMSLVYVSMFMIGMGIGGSANFMTSLPTSIFGRHGYDKVNSVLFPMQGVLTAFCFAINAAVLSMTGSYRFVYVTLGALAIANVIIILFINENKYNRDKKAEMHN